MKPTAEDVEDLRGFPFLAGDIDQLNAELPTYIASAADVNAQVDVLGWWKSHCDPESDDLIDLAHWSVLLERCS